MRAYNNASLENAADSIKKWLSRDALYRKNEDIFIVEAEGKQL